MIYYIEGCTCAGKSTMARQIVQPIEGIKEQLDWLMAPEHTPEYIEGEGTLTRQKRIFDSFMKDYTELLDIPKVFIADYSPRGVIPFNLALADYLNDNSLRIQAEAFKREWELFYKQHKDEICMWSFLTVQPETVIGRLKTRNRVNDDKWTPDFIRLLCKYYNIEFLGE